MKPLRAVLYLRSSKDRHDVAIEVQRRELTELARAKGFELAGEYVDVVESGKDDDRPGLQLLLGDLRDRDRTWSTVIALDTARIARRAAAAYWFEDRECRPRGVNVIYKNLPDMDDAERAIVKAVFHGVDEWHSLVSKRKGLAGMRQNVRAGHRAGGRAPIGYKLERIPTGAVRDGEAVMKSRLVLADDAKKVQGFLRDRAAGVARFRAAQRHGMTQSTSTLIGVERNARTYAGHTVWNKLKEKGTIGAKIRPEAEWEVKRDTHAALITDDEAAAILAQLSKPKPARAKPRKYDYLLVGLLCTPAGRPWIGDEANFYRAGRGRRILARRVDRTVVDALTEDLAGGRLAQALLDSMNRRLLKPVDLKAAAAARRRVDELDRQIRRLVDLAASAEVAAPLLRTVGEREKEREKATAELEAIEREAAARKALEAIRPEQVAEALRSLAVDVAAATDVPGLRHVLEQLLERVEVDPAQPGEAILRYRLPAISAIPPGSPGYRWRPHSDATYNPAESWLERRVKLAA